MILFKSLVGSDIFGDETREISRTSYRFMVNHWMKPAHRSISYSNLCILCYSPVKFSIMTTTEEFLVNWSKKRGTVRNFITKLGNNLGTLKVLGVSDYAAVLVKKLDRLDAELKFFHFK